MSDNVHSGHRARLRERFRVGSLAAMQEHEQLELLLFYAIPRCNTNETAHRLLRIFGSISAIIDAPLEELERVPGVGAGAGTFFRLLHELLPLYAKERTKEKTVITKPVDAARLLINLYSYIEAEALTLILLNSNQQVLHAGMLNSDHHDSVDADLRQIIHTALNYNASAIILGHNHPSGLSQPSISDLQATIRTVDVLNRIGVDLIDHIIVTSDDFYSFAENGHLRPEGDPAGLTRSARLGLYYDYSM